MTHPAGGVGFEFTNDIPGRPSPFNLEDDPTPVLDLTAITCDDGDSATASSGDLGTRTATLNLDPGETVTCTFTDTLKQFTLTVDKAGTGTGTVSSDPAGINCGVDCTEDYVVDTVVTLTAIPDGDSVFTGWSGDCSGSNSTATVSMDADKTCIAAFGYTWKVYLPLITRNAP